MKIGIITLSHFPYDKMKIHYEWHKRLSNSRVLHHGYDKTNNPDFEFIDVHGQVFQWHFTRIATNALKYGYDYYALLQSDGWILADDFVNKSVKYMAENNIDCLTCHPLKCNEHYKLSFSKCAWLQYYSKNPAYENKMNDVRHDLVSDILICHIFSNRGLNLYSKKTSGKITDEVDVWACISAYGTIKKNPFIAQKCIPFMGAMEMSEETFQRALADKIPVIHGLKDYSIFERNINNYPRYE